MHSSLRPSSLRLVYRNDGPLTCSVTTPTDRKRFWAGYLQWLSTATDAESDQLQRVLSRHAQHVRPVDVAVSDALFDPVDQRQLPPTLLATLVDHDWRPRPHLQVRACLKQLQPRRLATGRSVTACRSDQQGDL